MIKKKELGQKRKTLLNKCIAFGTEERFVKMIDFLERSNYNTSHYKQPYQKAVNYLKEREQK